MNATLRLLGLLLAGATLRPPLAAQAKTGLPQSKQPMSATLTIAPKAGRAAAFQPLTYHVIGGYVFEDVHYGGGIGHALGASGTVARQGVRVEAYYSSGAYAAATTTDANGYYAFSALPDTYIIRVVNTTVTSSRPGYSSTLVPVQTYNNYNNNTNVVGGRAPEKVDAGANTNSASLSSLNTNTTIAQSQAVVNLPASDITNINFGFNFDVVVNTNDAGQGSLRQFILNANALGNETDLAQDGYYTNAQDLPVGSTAAGRAGVALPVDFESSIFMIPTGRLTSGVAVITPASALPQLTGPCMSVNGLTQTYNMGNTNDVLLGVGGTVGTQATALSQLNGPEVQLVGNTSIATGLDVAASATNARLGGLAVYGFGNAPDRDAAANIRSATNGIIIALNVLGTPATSFTAPATLTNADNVRLVGGTNGFVYSNLIGFANGKGITTVAGVTNTLVKNNEIRTNGQSWSGNDGVDINGSNSTVQYNLLTGTSSLGFDSFLSTGGNTVTGNTVTDNGRGAASLPPDETGGIRVYGANNRVAQNIVANNYGAGVLLVGTGTNRAAASTTVISQNAIYGNGTVTARNGAAATGQIGIDLQVNGDNEAGGTLPFVTLNSATTTGANALLNYPVLRTASIVGSNLVLTGYAKPGAVIELFLAQANPSTPNATGANFGQGKTYLTTLTEGTNDADASTNQSYSGTVNGFNQGADTNANGFSFTIPLSSLPGGTLAAGTLLTSTATLNGATSEFSGNVMATAALTGYVYEDVNYGGGAGRSRATLGSAANGRPGATVELYNASGVLVATTTTDSNGQYAFGVAAASGYTVRVVNSTVSSSRSGYTSGLLPVPIYSGNASRVGGENPALADAAANTGSQSLGALSTSSNVPQSIASASVGTSTANAGPDFGFNFDVVVNTNDAGQGSLRQFILNSNALGGESNLTQDGYYTDARNLTGSTAAGLAGVALPAGIESSIFMIPVSGVAVITPASALPQITGANTAVNGATQTYNIGNSNNALLGNGGTVGTQATALSQLNGPEVQLVGNSGIGIGLNLAGAGDQVRGLAIYGFGNNVDNNFQANIATSANNVLVADNVLGSTATSFAAPPVANNNSNVRVASGTGVSFTNNLIGFANGTGIYLAPAVTKTTITGNEIRGNARTSSVYDGIDSHGSTTTATGNLFADGAAQGFDSYSSTGGNKVTGNTFTNNGIGNTSDLKESAAVRLYGTGNTFSQNISTGNYGAGVEVGGGTTVISQNSIYNNGTSTSAKGAGATGQIGIDLIVTGQDDNLGTSPFVTLNSAATTGANALLNYPVLRTASIVGSNLVLTGYAKPGAVIELFLAQANPSTPNATGANFGQGKTYLTTLTEGTNDADASTNQSYSGTVNGFNQGADTNANGFSFTIPLSSLPGGTLAAGTLLTSTATLNGATSEFSGNVATVAIAALTGYVYEDVNYGGGAGRSFATLATPSLGRAGAKVELYNSNEDLVGTAITDANGQYAFNANPGTGYTVRVVNNSVLSGRLGASAASGSASTGYVSNQLGVQIYNGTTDRVGGEKPALADAPANTGSQSLSALRSATAVPQSIATASVGTSTSNAGPDFGFNFDVVVNTNDAGLGSLRQFILNSNDLRNSAALAQAGSNAAGALPAGKETTIFMIPSGAAVPGQRAGLTNNLSTSGVAIIMPATALPAITGFNTVIDGTTQTFNIGNTNNVTLGVGGTVGTAATALSKLNGPEVQINGSRSFDGLSLQANSVTVRGVAIYGFTNNIYVGADYTGTLIEQNVVGTPATSFTDPGANVRTTQQGIELHNSDNGTVRNNLIGYNGGMGVWVYGDQNGANNNTVYNNEIRGNALEVLANGQGRVFEGLELQGNSTGNTVSGNLITESMGNGIDTYYNTIGGNTVTGNTISNNGQGIVTNTGNEGSGLRIYSGTNPTTISNNILSGNNASGVLLVNSAAKVLISQNSIFGNVRIGIDLLTTAEANANIANTYSGNTGTTTNVTRNSANTAGANGLLNYPVFTSATLSGSSLVVKGYAKGNALIEFFVAQPTASSAASPNNLFGQGATYLFTATEGTSADTDTRTGLSYGPTTNGIEQGSDTNANGFSFVIQLTKEQQAAVTAGTLLTSTATLGGVTSEFSGNIRITSTPLPVVLTAFTAQAVQDRDALLNWTTASEVNNDRFEIERSFDGTSFTQIGTVAGHGTTTLASAYSLTDAGVAAKANGPVYYRLRQVDVDGTATYSPVRAVSFTRSGAVALSLYPNPVADYTSLDLNALDMAARVQAQLLDATGRAVLTWTLAGGQLQPLDLRALASGSYLLIVTGQQTDGSPLRQVLRLSKN